jgi:formate dehydrogenase subunit gamma
VTARVPRFCRTTRWFHWTFALSFLSLAATGALLLARTLFGLEPRTAERLIEAHQIAAVVFLTAPWLIGLSGDRAAWLADLAEIARLGRDDLVWLVKQPLALLGRAELPPQHKLNTGQKLNALTVAAISGAMTVTGIHLWLEPGAFVALLVHVGGFFVWLPAFAVHLYMAVIHPSTRHALRAMTLGDVDREWAGHHHPRWLESIERGEPPPR